MMLYPDNNNKIYYYIKNNNNNNNNITKLYYYYYIIFLGMRTKYKGPKPSYVCYPRPALPSRPLLND